MISTAILIAAAASVILHPASGSLLGKGSYRPASAVSYLQSGRVPPIQSPSLGPDSDHPLIPIEPLRSNRNAFGPSFQAAITLSLGTVFDSAASAENHLLSTPLPAAPNSAPAFRIEGVSVPFLGRATIEGARLRFAHGPGSRFELRVDRPAAAFEMRF